ncbi:EAL domain-containing protein [Idiomarina seosinensis]|uniref:EAL domain-containing protein n=1 Tax=Idiomarina seosinensis TaxID=281739 RepID=UPI00384B187B
MTPGSAMASTPQALAKSQHWGISEGMTSHTITDLVQDPHGFLWIATRNGLQRFDGLQFEHFLSGGGERYLPSNHIIDLWFSGQQLWVSTTAGIAYYDYPAQRFFRLSSFNDRYPDAVVRQIAENFSQQLLLLSDGLLWKVSEQADNPYQVSQISLNYNGLPLTQINRIQRAGDWLWLEQQDGSIYVWDGDSYDVFKVTIDNPITDPLPAVGFNHIVSRNDKIWFAHDSGIFMLDENLRLADRLNGTEAIKRLAYVDNGHLLAGTLDGIKVLETPADKEAYINPEHTLPVPDSLMVSAFAVDHLKRLWLGAENGGLYQLTTPQTQIDFDRLLDIQLASDLNNLTLPPALRNYRAATLGLDNDWWFITQAGLVKYQLHNRQITEVHPLPSSQPVFAEQMMLFAERLFISTERSGLFIYDILERDWETLSADDGFFQRPGLQLASRNDKLWIADQTEARAVNEFLQVTQQRSLIKRPDGHELKPLFVELSVEQQDVTIDFVSPLAPRPSQAQYRYRLLDLYPEWRYTTRPMQPIALKRLPAADYTLQVQGSADGYNWSLKHQQSITIPPPWYATTLAYSLYAAGLVFVGLLSGLFIYRVRRHRQQLVSQQYQLQQGLASSGVQLWDWQRQSNELYRHNIWSHCPQFPLDGYRSGVPDTVTNIHPQDIIRLREQLDQVLQGKADSFQCSYRLESNGQWLWLMDQGQVTEWDEAHNPLRIQGSLTDISAVISREERLNMLALSLTNISDGICIYDRFFRKREMNKAFTAITGYQREQVLAQPFTLQAYDNEYVDQIKRTLLREGSWQGEVSDIRADGSEFQMELTLDSVKNDNGELELIVASFSDITERRHTENELRRLSNTDSLTGLPNRSYFQVSHSNLVRKKVPHALLLFDLDDFKKINDSLGHEIGDELLCRIAERLTDIGRRQDTLYRLGGDEFGLLVEDTTDLNTISTLANQINKEIAHPYRVRQHEVVIGSSIGIVLYPHDASTSQELLQKADTAMYHAKQRSGDCYQFFSQSMNENAIQRLQIENEVRGAIREQRVDVFYQPKIEPGSQHIAGIEALARIRRKDGSIISPGDFIPLAEETGLIVPLSEQVLRQACRDMLRFLALPGTPRHVAINLSARQFLSSSLAFQIEQILLEEKLHPRHMEFEITEGMVMSDPERAITMLENLSDMGVQLALDDFGTGYSSLAYLKRFPIHTLKIDKAFVDDISNNDKDRNMVASIVAMAHNLGLKVVAEGVETQTQLEILKTLRCEFIQGFYFAKPMSADDLIRFIGQHQSLSPA